VEGQGTITVAESIAGKPEGGFLLLELLSLFGWDVCVTAALGGDGVLVTCEKAGREPVRISGPSVAEIALEVYEEASRRS
jgi:hypothetical protein